MLATHAAELARILTGASGSAIAFREAQGTICRARSGHGAPRIGTAVDVTSGISKQCLDSGMSLCCQDTETDTRIDTETTRALGIRSIAVVPIHSDGEGGEICGILEIFSGAPGIFTDRHLRTLRHVAILIGSAANVLNEEPTTNPDLVIPSNGHADLALLIKREPAHRAFFGNLAAALSLRSETRRLGSVLQEGSWNYVVVNPRVPWRRFFQSVALHILVIGTMAGLAMIWPREISLQPRRYEHITYFPFSEAAPVLEAKRPVPRLPRHPGSRSQNTDPAGGAAGQPVASANDVVAAEPDRAAPAPSPSTQSIATRKPQLPVAVAVLPPPPDVGATQGRKPHELAVLVVPPPPDLGSQSRSQTINEPAAVRVIPPSPETRSLTNRAGIGGAGSLRGEIVPPPPLLNDPALAYPAIGVATSRPGVEVVAPPPSVQGGTRVVALGGEAPQVVPPPPSIPQAGGDAPGARMASPWTGSPGQGRNIVPPPPAISEVGGHGVAGIGPSADLGAGIVPPPPSLSGTGNSVAIGRANDRASLASAIVGPPRSANNGSGSTDGGGGSSPVRSAVEFTPPSATGDARSPKDVPSHAAPAPADIPMQTTFQNVELRVIVSAWAPPRSSYFSNFEVFIAEKSQNKGTSQLVKLVYEFLPYQRRLSEFGPDSWKVHKLRVTRDPSCDESLTKVQWPDGENGIPGSNHPGDPRAALSPDRDRPLPCYRTTADDFRRAMSGRR